MKFIKIAVFVINLREMIIILRRITARATLLFGSKLNFRRIEDSLYGAFWRF